MCSLAGCAVEFEQEGTPIGFMSGDALTYRFAEFNTTRLDKYRAEWRYNRDGGQHPPRLCVAFSGGGERSAAFGIGVLTALHRARVLEHVDVMSSVSGGGYALAWYYLQQRGANGSPIDENALFVRPESSEDSRCVGKTCGDGDCTRECSPAQERPCADNGCGCGCDKASDPMFCAEKNGRFVSYWMLGMTLPANVAMMPVRAVTNLLFDWRLNTSVFRALYEGRIKQAFHRPASADCDEVSALRALWFGFDVPDTSFPELRQLIEQRRLPFPIFNATIRLESTLDHSGARLANSVFEFTPLRWGAGSVGYFDIDDDHPEPVSVNGAIAISGAAIDSQLVAGSWQRFGFGLLNFDTGYFLRNPRRGTLERLAVHGLLPFPAYLFHDWYDDSGGLRFYLTDGGHSENLATFSLVRRLCDHIVIADAEQDEDYEFGGYDRLKKHLRSEMNVDLHVPDIDSGRFQQGRVMEGTVASFPVAVDGEGPCADGSDPIWLCNDGTAVTRRSAGAECAAPLAICSKVLRITYVKLSYDPAVNAPRDESDPLHYVANYAAKDCAARAKRTPFGDGGACFPQQPTIEQDYARNQFRAYRLLGEDLLTRYFQQPGCDGSQPWPCPRPSDGSRRTSRRRRLGR